MLVNYEELVKKILEFWREYDQKEIALEDLKRIFNYRELATILYDDSFCNDYRMIVKSFQHKISNLDNFLTENEAEELIGTNIPLIMLFSYLSDEKIMSYTSDEELADVIADYLKSDESRIACFNKVKDSYSKSLFVRAFDSDELKEKYMRKLSPDDRYSVITSFKDEKLLEKYITFFCNDKGDLISRLSNDENKIYYLRKFYLVLSDHEKAKIIGSLKDSVQVLHYLKKVNDRVRADVICYGNITSESFYEQVLSMISSKKEFADILKHASLSSDFIIKHIDKINDSKDLSEIIFNLEDSYKVKYIERFSDKKKIEIIKDMSDGYAIFNSFKYFDNKNLIIEIIEHCEIFPNYLDEYEYIIDLYSEKYNLNKEHLLYFVKNISFSVLRVIENENIVKILNASQKEFEIIMQFFNKEQLKQNSSSMNDILNTLLQREYRINYSEIILLFPTMLNAIDNNDRKVLLEKLNMILEIVNINNEISINNWSFEEFVNMLLKKKQSAIDCLHKITTKYITEKRNIYIQNNFESALEKSTHFRYDKKDLMKYMIENYPIELLLKYFPKMSKESATEFLARYTEEEINFLRNRELIEKIIMYKKEPTKYQQIPDDIKFSMKIFNNIFEKIVSNHSINYFNDAYIERKIYEFKEIDTEFLINIMMYLDIDKLRRSLFSNQDLLNKFMKFWNQYKIGGWGNTFDTLLSSAGLVVDEEIIANFIQYFGSSYETLEEKVEKGDLANISITALLDLASCYSSESKKYFMIFGSEDFKYIASNPGPNSASMLKEKRIDKAIKHLKTLRNREYVTIPSFDKNTTLKNGKNINIVVGNFSNMMNLTYGERTGACMRIGGAGKSLFDFCLENENGFHIRFCDPKTGNFISRVSGFRNGNTVFLNELRYSENDNYTNKDVVDACKFAAEEIIRMSKNSSFPIDNVVITPYYSMEESGMQPKNLGISDPQVGMKKFYTDVSESSVVLATSNPNNELSEFKLGVRSVPKYSVQRDKKRILYNRECIEYISHLKSLDQVLSGRRVEDVDVEINNEYIVCFAGEDWCVMVDKDGNIDKYIMINTNNKSSALDEMEDALTYLKENLEKEITLSSGMSLGM